MLNSVSARGVQGCNWLRDAQEEEKGARPSRLLLLLISLWRDCHLFCQCFNCENQKIKRWRLQLVMLNTGRWLHGAKSHRSDIWSRLFHFLLLTRPGLKSLQMFLRQEITTKSHSDPAAGYRRRHVHLNPRNWRRSRRQSIARQKHVSCTLTCLLCPLCAYVCVCDDVECWKEVWRVLW